jgi:hypothetical protein
VRGVVYQPEHDENRSIDVPRERHDPLMKNTAPAMRWREDGFVVLRGHLSADELQPAILELGSMFPTVDGFHDGTDERRTTFTEDEFSGIRSFPFDSVEWGLLAVHPKIVACAEMLLATDDIRLYSAEAWAKYSGAANYEQELHRDYLNHTLLVPSPDVRFRQVEMFLFVGDIPESAGPPHFVPRGLTEPFEAHPNWHSRGDRPEWYDAEVSAAGEAGTLVAYGIDTVHRASALTRHRSARYTIHVAFRTAATEWAQRYAWAKRANDPRWRAFLQHASVRQLALFGFPPPGHPYWTDTTLNAMHDRYPTLDLSPWRRRGAAHD